MKIYTKLTPCIAVLLLSSLWYACTNPVQQPTSTENQQQDSIASWIKSSRKKTNSLQQKKSYLSKAYEQLTQTANTSYKSKNLSVVAYRYYELKDTLLFKKINAETQQLAYQLKDSFTIADSHWSYADFYNKNQVYNKSFYHYNEAYKVFYRIDKNYEAARMLYAMAYIKGRYRDFTGSEVLTYKSIAIFKELKNYRYLYNAYNHLGTIQNDIQEYDKAILYYKKSLKYFDKIKNKNKYYLISLNNIGRAYFNKKEYSKALKYFNLELKRNLSLKYYSKLIDNIAYCRLKMKDTLNIKRQLTRSLHVRDSLNNWSGVVFSKIHLSDYHSYAKDTVKALMFAKQANKLSLKLKNGVDYLTTLKQLARLDHHNSEKYLNRYIQFNDSLHNAERKVQEKFTKIEFETDEHIQESKRLSEQTIFISITSVALILILSLAYFLRTQKAKNEKLLLEAEQQKANEQVYLLTLEQQAIIEEERVQERNRISEELHDGVLGRLFGTRVGLGFLDLNASEETEKQHEAFLEELQEIEKEIRDVSHKLSTHFSADQINFSTLINQLLKTNSTTGNFTYQVAFDDAIEWKNMSQLVKINIYRIVQESLQNIVKYAQAKNVILDFSIAQAHLKVRIQDDGVGFDIKKVKKGIGIKNMKSRVQKINGQLELQSTKNQGTSILLEIPVVS